MEGVTGLVDSDDVQPGGRDYERGRKPKHMGMLEGLMPEHEAMVCIGYHSRAGALGVLSHSFMGHEIEDMWLDGRPEGEIGLAHATAAAIGVPVAVLTGDDCDCGEMTERDATVTTVAVKRARDRFAADLRPAEEGRAAIEEAAVTSLSTQRTTSAVPSDSSTLTVRWQSASVASTLPGIPGVTSKDTRAVQAQGNLPSLQNKIQVRRGRPDPRARRVLQPHQDSHILRPRRSTPLVPDFTVTL